VSPGDTAVVRERSAEVGQTILILDDEVDMLTLLQAIITGRTDHEVVTSNNPLELEELIQRHSPGLIISDLKMLGRDGLEVIAAAHAIDPTLPVVIITAYGSLDSAEEAIRQGAYDYITKPFRKEDVLTVENVRLKAATGGPGAR
jgi:DNA-binding NtrC family response regulator